MLSEKNMNWKSSLKRKCHIEMNCASILGVTCFKLGFESRVHPVHEGLHKEEKILLIGKEMNIQQRALCHHNLKSMYVNMGFSITV